MCPSLEGGFLTIGPQGKTPALVRAGRLLTSVSSVPQFPHLEYGHNNRSYLIEWMMRIKEPIYTKCLGQGLEHGKCYTSVSSCLLLLL